jgi:hypothetical protein
MRRSSILALLALISCSSNPGSSSDPSSPDGKDDSLRASVLGGLCHDFWAARCAELHSCQPEGFAAYFQTVDTCTSEKAAQCAAEYTSRAVRVTATQLRTCFDAYGTLSCDDVPHFINELNPGRPAACDQLAPGTRADGASCAYDAECQGGRCNRGGLCGTCSTKQAVGNACSADEDCLYGLGCGGDGKCAVRANVGESCATAPCHSPLSCLQGVCKAPLNDGDTCDPTIPLNTCNWANGRICEVNSKTCQKQPIQSLGDECGYELDANQNFHMRGQCGPGYRCGRNAVRAYCVPVVHAGEGCLFSDGPDGAQCDHQSACVAGTCKARTASACTNFHSPPPPSGPNPGKLPVVTSFGGPVLRHLKTITVVFPGYRYASHVDALDEYIATSGWVEQVGADYGVADAEHLGTVRMDESLTGTVTNEQIQDFLVRKILDRTLPEPSPFSPDDAYVYMVYLPKNVVSSGVPYGTTCQTTGGYHDIVPFPFPFAYTVIPNCPAHAGYLETELIEIVAGHEAIEAATDPAINMSTAYYTYPSLWESLGGEVADMCDNYSLQGGFLMARAWSNTEAVAGHDPCLPHEAGNPPYFNAVSDEVTMAAAGTTATVTLTGWTEGARDSWTIAASQQGGSLTLPDGAITLDKTTLSSGTTATLSVAIPATAQSGSTATVLIASKELGKERFRYHIWLTQIKVM